MFLIPQPESDAVDHIDGCQVVPMWDTPVELAALIVALYDGARFSNNSLSDWYYLAGILRLSTKYFINKLRLQAIEYLSRTWSYTLKGHDDMVDFALRSPSVDGLSYPYVHPLHVLNLARETNVRVVVPSAVYFLSLYALEDLLRGDHPKLTTVSHPARPSSHLADSDIRDYTLMFQARMDTLISFTRKFCGARAPIDACRTQAACIRGFARLCSRLNRSWITRTGSLHFMSQAINDLSEDPKSEVCALCRRAFTDDVHALREKTWSELPSVLGLPPWEDLVATDLHS
ncbi:hypothetical protein MKEN_00920800 [Mycena kentingensis (nom. inval.)]|nr:hypothetical protein MKEN_00920800 [Mycena kentingensis (nom. inval.)]